MAHEPDQAGHSVHCFIDVVVDYKESTAEIPGDLYIAIHVLAVYWSVGSNEEMLECGRRN